jgi:hypothetical protein
MKDQMERALDYMAAQEQTYEFALADLKDSGDGAYCFLKDTHENGEISAEEIECYSHQLDKSIYASIEQFLDKDEIAVLERLVEKDYMFDMDFEEFEDHFWNEVKMYKKYKGGDK